MNSSGVRLVDCSLPRAWDTAAAALVACARALGDARDVRQIAAASGLAFRLSVDDEISLVGLHAYPWREVLSAAAERLGYTVAVVSSSDGGALKRAAQARAARLIRDGLDAGRPTLVWGVHAPEFGVARGLDSELLEVCGILDGSAPAELPLAELGRGEVPIVFALQLTGRIELSDEEAARAGLEAALAFGRGPTPTLSGFHTGLDAWRAMLAALERGVLDPAGLAYTAQRLAEARAAAAAWLDGVEHTLDLELGRARAAFHRSAAMLGELAACHPFPPAPSTMLTNSGRDQAQALVAEVLEAEAAGLAAVAEALGRLDRRRTDSLTVVDLDDERLGDLFACVAELPIAGLEREAAECRDNAGARLRGKLLYDGARLVGHVIYAPLDEAHYPVAADGKRWFVFCPWLARELRGRGAGVRLFAALDDSARAAGVDGLLTFATTDERFLHAGGLERHGFVEVGRRGELRLLERALSELPSRARLIELPERAERAGDQLQVVVRHGYNCPLLLRARRELATAARAEGLALDERDAGPEPSGASVGGRPVPHGFIPLAALRAGLRDELRRR